MNPTPTEHILPRTIERRLPLGWFADVPQLAELACLIDAVPPELRPALLQVALGLLPTGDFDSDYLIGTFRSRMFDCLVKWMGQVAEPGSLFPVTTLHLRRILKSFACAQDPAQSALALCDLLSVLAATTKSSTTANSTGGLLK